MNSLFYTLQQHEIFLLLNEISNETNKYPIDIQRIPWGHCIKSMISLIPIIAKFNKCYKHKISMRSKQTIVSALIDIDNVGNETTKYKQPLMHKIFPNIRKEN